MKLKKFDFKLPREEVRKKKIMFTIISVIVLILIVTIVSTFAYYQSIENQNPINTSVGEFSSGDIIFAVTIDGLPSNAFPLKNTGYRAESVTCDKGASGTWDNNLWNIKISNLTQGKTTCNIAFINEMGTLAYEIKQQGGGDSAIEAKGNPMFNTVPTAATSGIYATEDEYGTSYYYRGERNSLNNNLIFAGFQWKIVRINGDGSIRIIYNGTEAQFNSASTMNTTGTDTQIGTSQFNISYNDNKYVGYMFGGSNGVASTSRAQAVTNQTNSTIKTYIDAWYVNNIETQGTTVTSLLADNLFCNDRQLGREYPGALTGGSGWNGTGFGTTLTYYAPYYRHYSNRSKPTPTLKCAQKNDRFTVNDVSIGNGSLTYPVGLISVDEIAYGGTTLEYYDANQYLSNSQSFWSMSPYELDGNNLAFVWIVYPPNYASRNYVYNNLGVRSVLNLKSDIKISTGDGSTSNPFVVISN